MENELLDITSAQKIELNGEHKELIVVNILKYKYNWVGSKFN